MKKFDQNSFSECPEKKAQLNENFGADFISKEVNNILENENEYFGLDDLISRVDLLLSVQDLVSFGYPVPLSDGTDIQIPPNFITSPPCYSSLHNYLLQVSFCFCIFYFLRKFAV